MMSLYSEVAPASTEGDPPSQLTATCAISTLDRESLGVSAPLNAEVVLAAMSLDAPADASGTTTTNLVPPAIVPMPVGPTVRLIRLLEQRLSVKDTLRIFTMSFFIPVPDAFDQLIVAQFATPNLPDSRPFAELFNTLAATIRFYREGEPTKL
jgi:hypothetical protein